MHKLMEIVVYILALIGFACVIKHIRVMHCEEGCCMCGWHKPKVEESKTKAEEVKTKAEEVKTKVEHVKTKVEEFKTKVEGFKAKVHGEKRTGSRYGSNPVRY
ncbi:hypothetical protein [Methanosarcina sp.]|uniref:hypothetical protein n=1 Tax=Methanosarcina sp. TaxID=2213 RepID=UPI003C7247EE